MKELKEAFSMLVGEKPFQVFDKIMSTDMNFATLLNNFKVDIRDKEGELVVDADLPGLKREQINVSYEDSRLTITVKSDDLEETEEGQETERYIHRERRFSKMVRAFFVPNVDKNSIRAKYDNGVLTVILPKSVSQSESSINID